MNKNYIEIAGIKFPFDDEGFKIVTLYIEDLKEYYKNYADGNEILTETSERLSEHLLDVIGKKKEKIINGNEIKEIIKKMGTVKSIQFEDDHSKLKKRPFIYRLFRFMLYLLYWFLHIEWVLFLFLGSILLFSTTIRGPEKLSFNSVLTYFWALLMPVLGFVIGVILTKKSKLKSLLIFLYGFEIPIFLLSIFRIFIIQSISPLISLFLILTYVSAFILLVDAFELKELKVSKLFLKVKIFGYTIGSFLSVYILLIWSFFFPKVVEFLISMLFSIVESIFNFNPYSDEFGIMFIFNPITLVGLINFVALYFTPVFTSAIYLYKLFSSLNFSVGGLFKFEKFSIKFSRIKFGLNELINLFLPVASILITVFLTIILSTQKNSINYQTIDELKNNDLSFNNLKANFNEIYENEKGYKKLITDMYFSRYQYIFDDSSKDMFYPLYCSDNGYRGPSDKIFIKLDKSVCDDLYEIFSKLVFPFTYKGDLRSDFEKAQKDYEIIFDDSIQRAEKERINSFISNTFGKSIINFRGIQTDTASIMDEDEKKVFLSKVNYATTIDSENLLYKTEIEMRFENKEIQEQEVFIEFSIPQDSVISNLLLGKNLENEGIVAPKGAASQVYEASLRRKIDPALLELVGPSTYRLRVFPIPPATSHDGVGFQRVKLIIEGIIYEKFGIPGITYSRNLNINEKTVVSGQIQFENKKPENISFPKEIEFLNNQGKWEIKNGNVHAQLTSSFVLEIKGFKGKPLCLSSKSLSLKPHSIVLFVDVSKSAQKRKEEMKGQIERIVDQYKDKNITFEIYEFNYRVSKVLETKNKNEINNWLANLSFWGFTNKSEIIDELLKIQNSEVFIITDDSDFEFDPKVNLDINFTKINNSRFNLIQVGKRLTSQKEELNNLIWATGGIVGLSKDGNFYNLSKSNDLCEMRTLNQESEKSINKINQFNENKLSIILISDNNSRYQVARRAFEKAKLMHIVDPFNSMIAVDMEWQENILSNLSNNSDAFDKDYDLIKEELNLPSIIGDSVPEINFKNGTIIAIFFIILAIVSKEKRFHISFLYKNKIKSRNNK